MPSLIALASELARVIALAEPESLAQLLRGDDLGRLGRLAGGALEREQALAGVAEQALDALELEPLGLELLDQPQPLDVLRTVEAGAAADLGRRAAARARDASARCARSSRSRGPARRSSSRHAFEGTAIWCYITQRDIKRRYIAVHVRLARRETRRRRRARPGRDRDGRRAVRHRSSCCGSGSGIAAARSRVLGRLGRFSRACPGCRTGPRSRPGSSSSRWSRRCSGCCGTSRCTSRRGVTRARWPTPRTTSSSPGCSACSRPASSRCACRWRSRAGWRCGSPATGTRRWAAC